MEDKLSYEIIEHTADIGLRARAANIEKLFESCARGMMDIIMEDDFSGTDTFEIEKSITVEGSDNEDLLYAFLSEILYYFDGENIIPIKFENSRITKGMFETGMKGIKYDPEKHSIGVEIKAITYHNMKIEKSDDLWQTDVIFDV